MTATVQGLGAFGIISREVEPQDQKPRPMYLLVSRFMGQEAKLRPAWRYTQNQEAYELYLRGQYFFNTYTEPGTNKSAEYFQRAAEKDPNFALAYVGLAQCYHSMAIIELAPPADVSPRALAAATKALELDNSLAEAYTFLAMHKFSYEWDWAGAEELFERAIELQPDLALAYHWYTLLHCAMGRLDEAVDVSRKALRPKEGGGFKPPYLLSRQLEGSIRRRRTTALKVRRRTVGCDTASVAATSARSSPSKNRSSITRRSSLGSRATARRPAWARPAHDGLRQRNHRHGLAVVA